MARIFGKRANENVCLDREAVNTFFEIRAQKSATLGALSTVMYQDKNPELARLRDVAERLLLKDKIAPFHEARVLDLGCGNGRWAGELLDEGCIYHGVDSSAGLVEIARERYAHVPGANFSVCPIEKTTLTAIGEHQPFDRILCLSVFMYLNDHELVEAAGRLPALASERSRIVVREPVALQERLTILDHFSDDMEQTYNAIYRTDEEILELLGSTLFASGFRLAESGDVYTDPSLNNRVETRQRWFAFER